MIYQFYISKLLDHRSCSIQPSWEFCSFSLFSRDQWTLTFVFAPSAKMKTFCFCTQHASWMALVNHSQSCYQWHYTLVFWQIKDTVGFDTLGHCFFLEDGIEQRNTLFHNLGLLTKPGTLLPTDRNNSMCITMREKVFGNYIPVPATDCMWVIGGVKGSCVMAKACWLLGDMFSGRFLEDGIFPDKFKSP